MKTSKCNLKRKTLALALIVSILLSIFTVAVPAIALKNEDVVDIDINPPPTRINRTPSVSSFSTSSFTIDTVDYPATVNPDQTFRVDINTSYSFSARTDVVVGVWDYDNDVYIIESNDILEGSGSKLYSGELTAPSSGKMSLSAALWYYDYNYNDWILSDYRDFTVTVSEAEPDFTISATPSSQTVSQGDSTSYTISLTSKNGFNLPVTLSVSGLPSGATDNFNPSSVVPTGTSTLSVTTSASTPSGSHALTITGTGGGKTHDTQVTLVVKPVAAGPVTSNVAASPNPTNGAASVTLTATISIPTSSSVASMKIEDSQLFQLKEDNRIKLLTYTFDPLVKGPSIPGNLYLSSYPFTTEGYYLVQFIGPIKEEWKTQIHNIGAEMFDYIPENAVIVKMDSQTEINMQNLGFVRWIGIYQPAYKINPKLESETGNLNLTVVTYADSDINQVSSEIQELGGMVLLTNSNEYRGVIRASIDVSKIVDIANINEVKWIEEYVTPSLCNDIAADIMTASTVWQAPLTGKGQIIAVADSGLDTGNTATLHQDFSGNVVAHFGYGRPTIGPDPDQNKDWSDPNGHGTHVAGSVLGSGAASSGKIKGMAYEAKVVFQSHMDSKGTLGGLDVGLDRIFTDAYDCGARIHTNSWGAALAGAYGQYSADTDAFAWNHKDFTILFSAGNNGEDTSWDGIVDYGSAGSPGTAKDCITVGGSENYRPSFTATYGQWWPDDFPVDPIRSDAITDNQNGMVAFSSRGPCTDNRIKPDVLAPGTFVLSTKSSLAPDNHFWAPYNQYYAYMGGTSMSTPLTAGAAALVRHYYNNAGLSTPSSALIKATLVNGAFDMTPGQYASPKNDVTAQPDFNQGWGRVDLANSLYPKAPEALIYADETTGLSTGKEASTSLYVSDTTVPIKATLVWTDYPGSTTSGKAQVNDLDLIIVDPTGSKYFGNDFTAPYDDTKDDINNVECVFIDSPISGDYTLKIKAHNVPHGPQPFALVVSGGFGEVVAKYVGGAEYFIDSVGASGSGSLMNAKDGKFDSQTEDVTATVSTSGWTVGSSHTLYVHGKDSDGNWGPTQSVVVEVTSGEEADFSITASPSSRTVNPDDSTSYNITVSPQGGFSSPVTLSITGLPSGATGTFDPNPVTPAGITSIIMAKVTNATKIGSSLALLSTMKKEARPAISKEMACAMKKDFADVSIRFTHELSDLEIQSITASGIKFTKIDGEIAHVGTIYGAEVPWDRIGELANLPEVVLIESVWQLKVVPALELSVPEIKVDQVWQLTDNQGRKITGKGVKIANFDTGIDVFHPDFFRADGELYNWMDTNGNNVFDAGIDAVDLNGNEVANSNEKLNFIDATSDVSPYDPYPVNGTNDGVFKANIDWLYNDANSNGKRDYGTTSDFTEFDPTYGEPLFIVGDTNYNNELDTGEKIIALGTSKIYKTLNKDEMTRTRGVDLIQTQQDTNGHGTSVCGVLSGGTIGRIYVGVAPDADLLVADRYNNEYTAYIPWAENNGANVMLYEFGSWIFQFLDGSSNLEQMIDTEAGKGIIQIVPAGNLAGGGKHIITTVSGGGSRDINFDVPSGSEIKQVAQTVLWQHTSNNLAFQITTPGGSTVNLLGDNKEISIGDGHYVWSYRTNSLRGTAKFDISICKWDGTNYVPVSTGTWELKVTNSGVSEEIDGYIADDRSSWAGGATFLNFVDDSRTVTWPATADSAITVASYSTRGFGVDTGDLSTFSGRGPRIDGQHIMDIAAPGNYDIGSAMSKDQEPKAFGKYRWFGGTSAAGPHVTGAAALQLQVSSSLTHNQLKEILHNTARKDAFTGSTPNENWGYGKLDVLAAVNSLAPTPTGKSILNITTSPSTPAGSYTLTITGTGEGKTHDTQVIFNVTGVVPALSVLILETPDPVTSGGTSQVTVHITSSVDGSPVQGASVTAAATCGSITPSSGTTDSNGDFKPTYHAPTVTSPTTCTISANASKTGYTSGSGSDTILVNPAGVTEAEVKIDPSTQTVSQGSPFTVNVTVDPKVPIVGVQFDLSFNASIISANSVTEANLLKQGGANTYFSPGTIDNTAGTITGVAGAITTPGQNVSSPGTFAAMSFTAKTTGGTSPLDLSNVIVGDVKGNPVSITVIDGSVTVGSICPGDVNGDNAVNVLDMIQVGQRWGETGTPGWIPEDVNKDGVINVLDMIVIGQHWGPCP